MSDTESDKLERLIEELDSGCNDGGDLPSLLGKAARAIEAQQQRIRDWKSELAHVRRSLADHDAKAVERIRDLEACSHPSARVRESIEALTDIVGHRFVTTDVETGEEYAGYAMHTDEQARAVVLAALDESPEKGGQEYEWMVRSTVAGVRGTRDSQAMDEETARAIFAWDTHGISRQLMRRRPASEWVSEKGGQS